MKNYLKRPLLLLTSAALLAGSASAEGLKIATVNVEKLFKEYHKTASEQQKISEELVRLKKESEASQKSMQELVKQIADLRKKIEDPTLSEKIRTEATKTFKTKLDEGKAMEQEHKDSVTRQRAAIEAQTQASIQGIRQEITKLVTEHSKTEDFDYVFDQSGISQNQLPFLIYSKGGNDITEQILKVLNKDAPAK